MVFFLLVCLFPPTPPPESPLKFVVGLEPVSVVLGSTMTLSCQLNRAAGDVLWRHNGKEMKPGGRYVIRADGTQRLLTVSSVAQEDEGEYSCECRDDKTTAKITTKGEQSLHSTAEFSIRAGQKVNKILC